MIVYAVKNPVEAIGAFSQAVSESVNEAVVDTLKAFLASGGIGTVTDALADYFVEKAAAVAQGLKNLEQLVQSRVSNAGE